MPTENKMSLARLAAKIETHRHAEIDFRAVGQLEQAERARQLREELEAELKSRQAVSNSAFIGSDYWVKSEQAEGRKP